MILRENAKFACLAYRILKHVTIKLNGSCVISILKVIDTIYLNINHVPLALKAYGNLFYRICLLKGLLNT